MEGQGSPGYGSQLRTWLVQRLEDSSVETPSSLFPFYHKIQQTVRIFRVEDQSSIGRCDESLLNLMIEEGQKGIEEPVGIENPTRFVMNAQLCPSDHFTNFNLTRLYSTSNVVVL